jgi:hypothetical protein
MKLTASVLFIFDRDYEGGKAKTFAWVKSSDTSVEQVDPLMHSRIVNGIEYYLTRAGVREVGEKDNPDTGIRVAGATRDTAAVGTAAAWALRPPR